MKRTCLGFTLIELLIATSITAILFSLGMAQYMKFNRQQVLNQAVLELKTSLTNAQSTALAGKKECEGSFDGVLVGFSEEEDTYSIYSSCNNKAVFGPAKEYLLPQGVEIAGSPTEPILFKVLTGGTNLSSETTITLSFKSGMTGGVKVSPAGKIELVSE